VALFIKNQQMRIKIFRFFMRLVFGIIADVKFAGLENIPDSPSYVIAANHIGRFDTAMVFVALDRTDFILPVAEKYQDNPITRFIGYMMGAIWLDRTSADFKAIREIMARLKQGGVLVIAPEGTRSKTGRLNEGKPGVAYLAAKSGLPIVPVALIGTDDSVVVDNLKHLRRSHFMGIGGKSFSLPPIPAKDRDIALQAYTDEIMCRIAALLPEEKRGVYADHPRLKELLSQRPPAEAGRFPPPRINE
jgi:1-acyl-sn-glycerol-3-phosphate acyltransferase